MAIESHDVFRRVCKNKGKRFLRPALVALCMAILVTLSPIQPSERLNYTNVARANENQLRSRFLKDDVTAQAIASGQLTNYDINTFGLELGYATGRTDTFAYRVVSAIRQLGYSQPYDRPAGMRIGQVLLLKFQTHNRLNQSLVLTRETLLELDRQLLISETADLSRGPAFPLYARMMETPLNEPSKEHLARIYHDTFIGIPQYLVPWTEENFIAFVTLQLSGLLADRNQSDRSQLCNGFYNPQIGFDCKIATNEIYGFNDDYHVVEAFLHEYAHYMDRNIYYPASGLAAGLFDTTSFYSISFDVSKPKVDVWTFYPYKRGPEVPGTEFISSYGTGWQSLAYPQHFTAYEDFAESFAGYILAGNIFRELARRNTYLAQKYEWLKARVFQGIEYDTGDWKSIELLQDRQYPVGSYGALAFNVIDYAWINPTHLWDSALPKCPNEPCTYSISGEYPIAFPSGGSALPLNVNATRCCTWEAVSDVPWITLRNPHGSGPKTLSYSIAINDEDRARTGNIRVGGNTFTITQLPQPVLVSAQAAGKDLIVNGRHFGLGALVLINGRVRNTSNDPQNPTDTLIVKKFTKHVRTGETVTLQVYSGLLVTNQIQFTRQ